MLIFLVIQTWKDELEKWSLLCVVPLVSFTLTSLRHLEPSNAIRYCIYYGKDRTKFLKELEKYSLVITTYSVVRLDWKTNTTQPENSLTLHAVNWGRVVLDEGAQSFQHGPSIC